MEPIEEGDLSVLLIIDVTDSMSWKKFMWDTDPAPTRIEFVYSCLEKIFSSRKIPAMIDIHLFLLGEDTKYFFLKDKNEMLKKIKNARLSGGHIPGRFREVIEKDISAKIVLFITDMEDEWVGREKSVIEGFNIVEKWKACFSVKVLNANKTEFENWVSQKMQLWTANYEDILNLGGAEKFAEWITPYFEEAMGKMSLTTRAEKLFKNLEKDEKETDQQTTRLEEIKNNLESTSTAIDNIEDNFPTTKEECLATLKKCEEFQENLNTVIEELDKIKKEKKSLSNYPDLDKIMSALEEDMKQYANQTQNLKKKQVKVRDQAIRGQGINRTPEQKKKGR
jgi:soluble cytochrome b562